MSGQQPQFDFGAGDRPAPPKPAKPATSRKPRTRKAPPPPPGLGLAALVTMLVVALDQLSKYIVVQVLELDRIQQLEVLDPWLNLRMAWNQGVNFGLFASDQNTARWLLIAVALAVCAWVALWLWRTRPGRFAQVAAGLLIGGALGNVIDRATYGAVADFLNMSLPNWRNPYSFNIADIAIFAGAFGLVLQPGGTKPAAARNKPRDAGRKGR